MSTAAPTRTAGPLSVVTGALLTAAVVAATLFAVAFDQGQIVALVASGTDGLLVHELFHDARHMLGVPCH